MGKLVKIDTFSHFPISCLECFQHHWILGMKPVESSLLKSLNGTAAINLFCHVFLRMFSPRLGIVAETRLVILSFSVSFKRCLQHNCKMLAYC